MQRAQRLMRPELPKRFYKAATAGEGEGGFRLLLDGRGARTPARNPLAVPSRPLAEALAEEWNAQGEVVDPASMPLTRLVNSTIDGVVRETQAVRAEIVKYAGSDLLCYRAAEPEGLVLSQSAAWDPIIAWSRETLGARLVLAEGVMFAAQPAHALEALCGAVAPLESFALAAVHSMTTLTGSALLALAVARGRLDAEAAWAAAHVDEDWNIALWGEDAEAAERRRRRFDDMRAAARVLALLR